MKAPAALNGTLSETISEFLSCSDEAKEVSKQSRSFVLPSSFAVALF
jgi:hypothetical protein